MMSVNNLFSRVLKLIDESPHKKWSLQEMARIFYYSPYHFHRLFKELSGETFQQFMMKRRLSYSAQTLMNDAKRVLDVAFDFEYQSHEAFSRAFKNTFHITPSTFRKNQASFNFFRQNFLFPSHIKLPNPLIKKLPAFTHTGIKYSHDQIGNGWGRLIDQIDLAKHKVLIGLIDDEGDEYIAGVKANAQYLAKPNYVTYIEQGLYVTMYHYGSYETIIDTYRYLFEKWLPSSLYTYDDNKMQLEIYAPNKPVNIFIPIRRVENDELSSD